MVICPNENLEDYKQLEEAVGKTMAYYYWNKFDGFEKDYTVKALLTHLDGKYNGYSVSISDKATVASVNSKTSTIIIPSKVVNDIEAFYKVFEKVDLTKYNLTLDKIKSIITNEADIVDFIVYKKLSEITNPGKLSKEELDIRSTMDALNRLRTDITKLEFQDKTINDIRIFIQNSIEKVKKDIVFKKDSNKLKKIEDLQKLFEQVHASEKPKIFIEYYHSILRGENNDGFVFKLDNIIKRSKEVKTKQELDTLTRDLVYYYNFAEELEKVFEDIDGELKDVKYLDIINAEKGSTFSKLREINEDRNRILTNTKKIIPEIMADQMLPYVSTEAQKKVQIQYEADKKNIISRIKDERLQAIALDKLDEKYKDLKRDRESLVQSFKAFKDQTVQEYWTSPTISSSDPLLSLFAKFVKEKFEEFRLTLQRFEKDAGLQYKKYKTFNKGNVDNVKEYNKDLYELIKTKKFITEVDSNGIASKKEVEDEYYSFVNKYDVSKYNTSLNTMLLEADKIELTESKKKANRYKAIWYSENTEARSGDEINSIIESHRKELTKEDFEEWLAKNRKYNPESDSFSYRGPLSQPKSSNYSNPKYIKIQNTPQLKEIYDWMVSTHLESQEMLPLSKRIGMKIPPVPKSSFEKLIEKGVINSSKDWINKNFKKSELDYDTQSSIERGNKELPIYYTKQLPIEEVSLDLIESVMKYRKMALKFRTVFDIKNEVKAASIVANNRVVEMVDPKGMRYLSSKAKALGIDRFIDSEDIGNSAKWMEAFIDMQIYNKMKNEEYIFGVRADKIGDFMMQHTSFTSIGIPNVMKALVNNLQANIQIAVESWTGDYLNYTDLTKGRAFYASKIADMSSDIGKPIAESFTNQLNEVFDFLQGEYIDSFGNKVSGSQVSRHFTLGLGYALQHAGEHQAQVSMGYGLMNAVKLKHNGKDITLLEAYELKDGKLSLKEGIDEAWNPFIEVKDEYGKIIKYEQGKEFKEFVNRAHAINKRLHGVYNKFDKASIERGTAGRLLMFFRKFVVPGIKKRYKSYGIDEELGSPTEGTYRTLGKSILYQRADLLKFLMLNENNLTEYQKKNIKRSLIELTFIVSLITLSTVLASFDDGDDDSYAYNFAQYEIYRLNSEMQFYLNPKEFYRVLKTPTVASTKTEQGIKLFDQIIGYNFEKGEYNLTEEFDKNVGEFTKKGDNKAIKYGMNVLGIDLNNHSPEYALNTLEKLTKR